MQPRYVILAVLGIAVLISSLWLKRREHFFRGSIAEIKREVGIPVKSQPIPQAMNVMSEEEKKAAELDEILKAKNDNDPRLDKDFQRLTAADKKKFREKYASLPLESRNGRGTILFLLGRNLDSSEDFRFFEDVLLEAPCLSLSNCHKEEVLTGHGDEHSEAGLSVTLAYPQLVVLASVEKLPENSPYINEIKRIVDAGLKSNAQVVAEKAAALQEKFDF